MELLNIVLDDTRESSSSSSVSLQCQPDGIYEKRMHLKASLSRGSH